MCLVFDTVTADGTISRRTQPAPPVEKRASPPATVGQNIQLRRQQYGKTVCVTLTQGTNNGNPVDIVECTNAIPWQITEENHHIFGGSGSLTAVGLPNNHSVLEIAEIDPESDGQKFTFVDDGHIQVGDGKQCIEVDVKGKVQTYACLADNPNQCKSIFALVIVCADSSEVFDVVPVATTKRRDYIDSGKGLHFNGDNNLCVGALGGYPAGAEEVQL